MKNKKIIITLSIIAILVLTIGITYSIFTSSKTSKNSNLVVGDIYMHYNETNQIQMENAMPTNPYIVNPIMATQEYTKSGTNELSKCVDSLVAYHISEEQGLSLCKGNSLDNGITLQQAYDLGELDEMNLTDTFMQENILTINSTIPYFEFTVDGKNTTTNKNIWYEVVLSKGDNIDGKTRIKDNLLKFRLTETKDDKETIVVNNKSYSDLTSKRIWVDTINKNTINEVVHTYRLYMWISNDTVIGNVDQDYTMEEWKSIFASIKVGVSGDFNEKYLPVEVETSCFTTEENETGLTITDYNSSCGSKIVIPATIDGANVVEIASNAFNNKGLIYVDIPSSIVKIGAYAFTGNNITSINVPETVTNLHCKSFDDGVVKNRDMTCIATNESCFTVGTINDGNEVAILDYDATCGTDVIIPSTIKGYPVTVIGNSATTIVKQLSNKNNNYNFNNLNNYGKINNVRTIISSTVGSFQNKNLTSVIIPNSITIISGWSFANNQLMDFEIPSTVTIIGKYVFSHNHLMSVEIPDSVTTIGDGAFGYNQLTSVEIPGSVITIGACAFEYNQLTSIKIGSGVQYIDRVAFLKTGYSSSNPNLSKIKINKTCSDIKNIQASSINIDKYYPWLSYGSPYTATGVTIYGSNNEVCDSY